MQKQQSLIIGANSGIAKALAAEVLSRSDKGLILVSRDLAIYENTTGPHIHKIEIDNYHVDEIKRAVRKIQKVSNLPITQVFICQGLLHSDTIKPEKRLEDIDTASFQQIVTVNALTPLLWLQQLVSTLTGAHNCKVVVFSARVGSINDNQLGGWYSYRASKAALNMMLKNAAIELARRAKNIKIISFHPGTTDTELSKPFHANVPAGKLFTPKFVAQQLFTILANTEIDGTLSFLDWQGKSIEW
ncbi:SDR family NAD(P)-dependent oxidoreductase [Psychrosphaera sp. 1_MG-2023]|uniref:SDR family NAD(P)-dependent oxidoreductase n=1 Tax=Psychrosphaera sp. 1_MG-2023 TaxID=3062643 RepID=UPI0026E2F761|nr:SDR family NAD(P)-dependent oxidoreductase [Psychrosphaera sp. 1_MG-2023]MDO6719252.1 SDR family NAD(P)-dependent oxidoreductase [Psychrosphaera sp. 1_MG-2023]